jgi:hypothetical protein
LIVTIPDLSFPGVEFTENETPWNLNVLLFEGGYKATARLAQGMIAAGELGQLRTERLELVLKLHETLDADTQTGTARSTTQNQILRLKYLFGFAERNGHPLTIAAMTSTYCAWADSLLLRTKLKKGTKAAALNPDRRPLSFSSAYTYVSEIATLLNPILERSTNIVELTRLVWTGHRPSPIGVQAEKQNLQETFEFGHMLQDLADGLTLKKIRSAPLPLQIVTRDGRLISRNASKGIEPTPANALLGERYPLANLRIEVELHIFIAQTGMNLEQSYNLELKHFSYVSHLDGYQVKEYKARRGGIVLFEIFKEYRSHFERYLDWRRALFSKSQRLFPFIGYGEKAPARRIGSHRLRDVCKQIGLAFFGPQYLRNTRVNWLLRKTADPNLTAEMGQHAKETLLEIYHRPSYQRAIAEAAHFWSAHDPHSPTLDSVLPGKCSGTAEQAPTESSGAPRPDCIRASGCLWCKNHRDLDSQDYVWAMATFQHLKILELSKSGPPSRDGDLPPAQRVIDRIHAKLSWFADSNAERREWVTEARALVVEGDFHSHFRNEIAAMEGLV